MKNELKIYRALSSRKEKATFAPTPGAVGAPAVRKLQALAQALKNRDLPLCLRVAGRVGLDINAHLTTAGSAVCILPLSPDLARDATLAAQAAFPRKKNWVACKPVMTYANPGAVEEVSFEYRGAYKGWFGSNFQPVLRSVARINKSGLLGFVVGSVIRGSMVSGRGYVWDIDENGLRIVRKSDGADYHPHAGELQSGRKSIIEKLRANAERRRIFAKTERRENALIKKASKHGIFVCLADSVAAGNCRIGTESFAIRHGLNLRKHYKADELPRKDSEESRRVVLAVLAAARRQVREHAQGFCEMRA